VLIAALLGLVESGPGALSLDRALGIDQDGPGWALASLGAGALASAATVEMAGRRGPAAEDEVARRRTAADQEPAATRS
jgi:putative oxidoreductase